MDACDPDADVENLRQLIKINTGVNIKLTKKEICQAYEDIQGGKLPLPPLVMNSTRTYLIDKKSPLKPNDYELLFDSSTKRVDLKKIARKVNLKNVDQMTKCQIVDAIGKRLRYMKVHEPVKFARRTRVSVNKTTAVNENNTAVNNVNNFNTNRVNNNVNRVNNNTNRVNNNTNRVNNNVNRVNNNVNRVNNNVNRVNNLNTNVNRANGARPDMNFSGKGVFRKGEKPAFLGGTTRAVREPVNNRRPVNMNQRPVTMNTPKKPTVFGSIFGKKKDKNFVPAKKFGGEKPGYAFKQGNKGLGYYINTGPLRAQGPSLPSIEPQPIPANQNLTTEQAVGKIKQLGLRREKKFLRQLELGTVSRKQVVAEATRSQEEEKRFLAFIDGLKLLNIESEYIKQRMAVDDLRQLRVEAQIKADERANVTRSNEEKMAMFLESTTLGQKDKNSFLDRARQDSANVNKLILEIKKLISQEMDKVLNNKRQEFTYLLKNYNKLSNQDKNDLVKSIDEKTNTNAMKKLAENLLKKRIDDKKNIVAQNLLSFLTPLKINQTNKNTFVKRFKNDDVDVNTLKREALNMEKSKMSGNVENLRVKLNTRMAEIGLNQLDQNAIMKKFRNGNRNVEKLLQEAKNIKSQRNVKTGNRRKEEYISYIATLSNLTNEDKKRLINSGNLNRNKAFNMSKKRGIEKKEGDKKEYIGFLADLGLTNENRITMIDKYNANRLNVEVLKKQAIELRSGKISEKKAKLLSYINTLDLGNENRQKLLNRVENTNLNILKANANGIAKKNAGEKEAREKRELEMYINGLGLTVNNKRGILNRNPSLSEGKRMANTKVQEKQAKNKNIQNKKELEAYINSLGLNTNTRVSIMNQNISTSEKRKLADIKFQEKQTKNRKTQNKKELEAYINSLGLNTNTKYGIMSKNISISEKRKLADIQFQEKQTKNRKTQNRKELEKYINNLGLNTNNKSNILSRNVYLNEGRKLANAKVQMKIKEKRNKDKVALSVYLNKLGLATNEKNQFLQKFNTNVNVNTIKINAKTLIDTKKTTQKMKNRQELQEYMSKAGLGRSEQSVLFNQFNRNMDNVNALKKEADKYIAQQTKRQRAAMRDDLFQYLKQLNITKKVGNSIMKEFNNTNTNAQILKNRANGIVAAREEERFIQEEGQFMNYLNTLEDLTAENKSKITEKLNSYYTNWNSLKKSATNTALGRSREKRQKQRNDLSNYANSLGLNNTRKNSLLKALDNQVTNVGTLKREADKLKNQMISENKLGKKKKLLKSLTNLDITNQNRASFIEKFGNNTSTANAILEEAKQLEVERIKTRRDELFVFMGNLDLEQNDKNLILRNFDANPRSNATLRNKAKQLKSTRNNEEREKIRRELKGYLNTLNMLNNVNKKKLMANNSNNVRNKANQLQANKKAQSERKKEFNKLSIYINSLDLLNQTNKQKLLANNSKNINSIRNKANQLQANKKAQSERKKEFNELSRYINSLDLLNQTNKQKLLANISKNINSIRNEANQLQSNKKAQLERKKEREDLDGYINTLNMLTKENKQKLLENVTITYNTVRNEANKLQEFKKAAKRGTELNTLKKSMNTLNQNSQLYVIDKFESQNVTLNSMLKEVGQLKKKVVLEKRAKNRSELVDYMNTLDIGNTDKKKIIKNYDSIPDDVSWLSPGFLALKNRATQINAKIKNKAQQRQELSNYINDLGVNGAQLLKKLNDGRSTLIRLKADANRMKSVSTASLVNSKKDQLRAHMKNTRLDDKNKKSFIGRVTLNTNMNSIKGEVNNLNTQLKTRNDQLAAKKSDVSVFLNTLNDLRPENRKVFLAKVTTANTDIEGIKRDATSMNKAVKNRRVETDRKKEEEKKKKEIKASKLDEERLSKHLKGLKHLTSPEMSNYMSSFLKNGAKFENVVATSKAKDKDNEKDKDTLRFYIRDAKIPQARKDLYIRQLLQPHVNTRPIKGLVNVEKERERIVGERIQMETARKLKSLKDITVDERVKFINSLKNKTPKDVLAAAEKLDTERKEGKKTRDKGIKNVANELSKLTTIERDNRKKLMNRLQTNGAEKVLANARQLNRERKITEKQPLLNKVAREITGTLGVWRRGWEDAIRKATKPEELQSIDRLLDEKVKLRKDIEQAPISEDKRRGQIRFVMKMTNDIEKRKQELAKNIKAKRDEGDKVTGDTAKKLQSMNKLGRDNRKLFMNRIAKGEDARTVLKNAEKLGRDRTAKQRLEAERKQREQNQAQERKVGEQKKREDERAKGKAKGELARSLSTLKTLNRSNRTEFIERLNKGNSANAILRNARKRNSEKGLAATKPTNNPLFRKAGKQVVQNIRMKTMTNAVKRAAEVEKNQQKIGNMKTGPERIAASRNLVSKQGRDRGQTAEGVKNIFGTETTAERMKRAGANIKRVQDGREQLLTQKKKNREEAERRSVSVKKAQKNRQMREKEERAKVRANAEAKSLKEKVARNKAEADKAKARANIEAKSLKEKVIRNKAEADKAKAQALRDESERRRLAMLESQKKKDAKAALRKANKKLAKATGQGVKGTQKRQQASRRV
jgi:hypothetical protein